MPYTNKIKKTIKNLEKLSDTQGVDFREEIESLENKITQLNKREPDKWKEAKNKHTPWERVKMTRNLERPKPNDYIFSIIKNFTELHGDRAIGDDSAIVGGIGWLKDIPVTAIGTRRGKELKENMRVNFGMVHPEGYRKALRLAKQAERFNRPVLFFVDTPGAFCGIEAEERGISEAIARNLYEFSDLEVPTFTVITGEGGSGGALGLTVANKIYMMENSTLSVISPEGCASILFKDSSKADEAASSLKLTPYDLYELGIIDEIITEDKDFENKPNDTFNNLEKIIYKDVSEFMLMNKRKLIDQRYEKYRNIGFFETSELNSTFSLNKKQPDGLLKKIGKFFGFKSSDSNHSIPK
jgi:acetyl-CoA carboxylase carboxyl transferase subunit alpha